MGGVEGRGCRCGIFLNTGSNNVYSFSLNLLFFLKYRLREDTLGAPSAVSLRGELSFPVRVPTLHNCLAFTDHDPNAMRHYALLYALTLML